MRLIKSFYPPASTARPGPDVDDCPAPSEVNHGLSITTAPGVPLPKPTLVRTPGKTMWVKRDVFVDGKTQNELQRFFGRLEFFEKSVYLRLVQKVRHFLMNECLIKFDT